MTLPGPTDIAVLSVADCESLFVSQAVSCDRGAIGWDSVLPVSEDTWSDYYHGCRPASEEPWWVHRTSDAGSFTGLLWVEQSLAYFPGHFPANPILPGVVQINWAIAAAETAFMAKHRDDFTAMTKIKFKARVLPRTWLRLILTESAEDVAFVFRNPEGICSQGILHYCG